MWGRIFQMLRKEFILAFRDAATRAVMFGVPVIQLMLFGYVVSTDVRNIRFAVLDQDRTAESRTLVERFASSPYFSFRTQVGSERELDDLLRAGRISMALHIPEGFSGDLSRRSPARVQTFVDGTVSNIAAVAAAYTNQVMEKFIQEEMERRSRRLRSQLPPEVRQKFPPPGAGIDLRVRAWYNADLESRNFFLPGVFAFLVMIVSMLLTSMAVVREKEAGTLEQLIVTPLRAVELILGKTLPFLLTGWIDMILVVGIAVLWFEVPLRGSLPLLFAAGVIFMVCSLGLGLLISTISSTMQQAVMTTFFFLNPLFLLSGFAFPIEDMPPAIQYLTLMNPLRHFLVIVRGIFLRGIGLELLWPQFLALAAFALVILTAATLRFHKHLE